MRRWKCVRWDGDMFVEGKIYEEDKDGYLRNEFGCKSVRKPFEYNGNFKKVNEFTKEDLKPCMVVALRCGILALVTESTNGTIIQIEECQSILYLSGFKDDLTEEHNKNNDIIRVYGYSSYLFKANELSETGRELLWEREEKSQVQIEIESIEAEQRILAVKSKELADRLNKVEGKV